ncbi:hypothetical protein [Amycolatopsis sp. NPDC051071]|uniref:hypothetical protein n=1 Tax=Amycolatopsis sp. NPDC051071 TaxID=3154637 RepID=UPI003440F0A2
MNVSDLAGRLRDLRFDGYTDTGIATEIERFRSGDGTGSIGTAVDALKSVATALADTDKTLRDELGKLGVEWQSEAGGAAGEVFTEQAGFSQDANSKVSHSAEMIFSQGEAFNRTLYKLPDPETVRKGAGGFTIGDVLLSLIGFETDHAKSVDAANNARAQAQEALNDYAKTSGENLLSTDTLADPQALNLTQTTTAAGTGGGSGALDLAGTATDLTPDGSVRPASAAVESKYVPPTPVVQPVSNPKSPSYDAPTPAYGVALGGGAPARKTSSVTPHGGATAPAAAAPTTPSGTSRPVPAPGSGWTTPPGNRPAPQPEQHRPSYPITGAPGSPPFVPPGAPNVPPGQSTGTLPPSSSTTSALPPGKTFGTGPGVESALGKGPGSGSGPGVFSGVGGGTGGGDQTLGKGRTVGTGPQVPLAAGNESGRGFPAVPKITGPAAGDLGAGAAALGAGVAGGALSGDKERDRRPREEGGSGKPTRQLPIGELPEEEAMRRSEKIGAKQPKPESKFMERAATQDVEEDAEHIRRFGVDDKDLFTDERMVSPDVIGDHGNREAR